MEHNQPNVLLVLMCLDLKNPNPLRSRSESQVSLEEVEGRYQLLVAVCDPANPSTSAPVMAFPLTLQKLKAYNDVLKRFHKISARFYGEGGFVDDPSTYTDEQQEAVLNAMSEVGTDIYDFFQTDAETPNPIRKWLDKLLGPSNAFRVRQRPTKPVTILTNDFGIPWFWLKRDKQNPFLCEVCSLGLLQLSAVDRAGDHQAPPGQRDKTYEALLIKGSTTLPFQDEELNNIATLLSETDRRLTRAFIAHRAATRDDFWQLLDLGKKRLLDDFRIIHFSGHYSSEKLLLSGGQLPVSLLHDMLGGSLLVLDGCSSASKLDAWADIEGLTSSLINEGALGCVVTVLPVKHDPIVSNVLWGAFYRELRLGSSTVGQALAKARGALRDHFETIGSHNPAWAVYQLIGSPAVQLCDEGDEEDEGDG
ncbi:MAG TPA: CHAT domain-containing protein [Blastocatellia bacterium]|nr:CHAT domain-containing protein [Blastocatellia bacterium]